MKDKKKLLLYPKKALENAKPTDIFDRVRDEIAKEQGDLFIDELSLRRAEDWRAVANTVVGSERS